MTDCGGDGKSLRAIELQPAEQLAALEAGRIDAAVLKAPFMTVGLQTGKLRLLGQPMKLSRSQSGVRLRPPEPGEHTAEILGRLSPRPQDA